MKIPMNPKMLSLLDSYSHKKGLISKRIREFREVFDENDERIFAELSFCICTPQSKALASWEAISNLVKTRLLFEGTSVDIAPLLKSVRFPNNKARYIVGARKLFTECGYLDIKNRLNSFKEPLKLREWLVENVVGIGMKEASHFLRNIGLGKDLAILDRHVIRNLEELEVIQAVPKNLSEREYLAMESCMKTFSQGLGIEMDELDLLFWSKETGFIFK